MNKETIQKHTASYDEYLLKKLKDFEFAKTYLETAFEDYEEDGDTHALLLAMREVAQAQGDGVQPLSLDNPNLLDTLSGLGFRVRLERQDIPAQGVSAEPQEAHA